MLINAAAPDGHRAAALSAFYLVAYFVQGAVALLLGLAELVGKRQRSMNELGVFDAIVMGCAQCLALIPGSSRSGSTIMGGLFAGERVDDSVRRDHADAMVEAVGDVQVVVAVDGYAHRIAQRMRGTRRAATALIGGVAEEIRLPNHPIRLRSGNLSHDPRVIKTQNPVVPGIGNIKVRRTRIFIDHHRRCVQRSGR